METTVSAAELTRMLPGSSGGDQVRLEHLTPIGYQELHRIARRNLAPSVNLMREILIDFARAQKAVKRGLSDRA